MITELSGPVWRILFRAQSHTPLAPARAPEGRFHHSGQFALYASLSAQGAGIAIRRYVTSKDAERTIQRFSVLGARLLDVRGNPQASIVWQDIQQTGAPSPTWAFSDAARQQGADGLIYSSRSRPDLSHLVLFGVSDALIWPDGEAQDWFPLT